MVNKRSNDNDHKMQAKPIPIFEIQILIFELWFLTPKSVDFMPDCNLLFSYQSIILYVPVMETGNGEQTQRRIMRS
jgi:hypothetical protein